MNRDTDFPPPHRVSFVPSLAKFVDRSCTSRIAMTRSVPRQVMSRCVDIKVKGAFRQIPVEPLHAAKLGDVFGEYVLGDLFRQFEGRCSPGFSGLVAT